MSMFLRKKWLLPSILNRQRLPHEPSAQILRFIKLPNETTTHAVVQLSDKFNYINAVLTDKALAEFNKDHPSFTDLRNLSGAIIALINFEQTPYQQWTKYGFAIDKFNYICDSEPVGEPQVIEYKDIEKALKQQRDEDEDINNYSQASQLVQMADLLSQVDDSVNQSVRGTSNNNNQNEMELDENDFVIPEDQKQQLDRIPGWVDEELSQVPASQSAPVNESILPSVSQSVHKTPTKVPTGFYQGQPALELAMDVTFDNSDDENQSKDQEQMNIEKDVLGAAPPLTSSGALNTGKDTTPQKIDSAKADQTFDEETEGPEELANFTFQTQSLPMTLSTNDLAKSSEKPSEEIAQDATEAPKATEAQTEPPKNTKKKKESKKKKAESPTPTDAEPTTDSGQKETGETSKPHRSTRSKKKAVKSSTAENAEDKAKDKQSKETPKNKKKSDKAKDKTKDKASKDRAKDKTSSKAKDKTKNSKKHATESATGATDSNSGQAAPEKANETEASPKAVEQPFEPSPVPQPAEKPAEVSTPGGTASTDLMAQETVVLHYQNTQANLDPNKIYDEQNRSIPNLNEDDADSGAMTSFHQEELESASQMDLNAVPDYIVEASPDKSSYPLIRDLGSPLIASNTSSNPMQSQAGFHFGHSNQEFSLGMPSDASSQARNVVPSQSSAEAGTSNTSNLNNTSEGSEENVGKSGSSSISQELISGTMRNSSPIAEKSPEKETPAKDKHSLLEEMLMSDPIDANNINDSQVDNNEEYFTQQPGLLGDSESQWEGARPSATQGVVPVVPQSQGDLHSEFFSSSDDSGKDKQSQLSGQANAKAAKSANDANTPGTPTTSPTSKKDSISPKARRHLEFDFEKDAPSSPTKSPPVLTQKPASGKFKFSLPKATSTNPQKRINLSTQQTQLPRMISTSPPNFKKPIAKSPAKEHGSERSSASTNSPTKSKPPSSPEKRVQETKEVEKDVEREVEDVAEQEEYEDIDEIVSEQRPREEEDDVPPLIRVNSTDVREQEHQEPAQRPRSRSKSPSPKSPSLKSPSPKESTVNTKGREDKSDRLKYVIDLEDLSPRFFNKTKQVKQGQNNTNTAKSKERALNSGSAYSSPEPSVSPPHKAPVGAANKTVKKTPSPSARPGSLGDLIRQSRQQSLSSKDPTMEFVIGYFKEVTTEPKPAARAPRFASNTNSNTSASGSATVGVKRKIDYYGWLDLTSNKKRKVDHNDKNKK